MSMTKRWLESLYATEKYSETPDDQDIIEWQMWEEFSKNPPKKEIFSEYKENEFYDEFCEK